MGILLNLCTFLLSCSGLLGLAQDFETGGSIDNLSLHALDTILIGPYSNGSNQAEASSSNRAIEWVRSEAILLQSLPVIQGQQTIEGNHYFNTTQISNEFILDLFNILVYF